MKIPAQHEDKVKIVGGLLLFFAPVILYSLQIPFYQNCFNISWWLFIYALIGAAIGGAVGVYMMLRQEGDFQKFQIVIAGIILGLLLIPLLATLINRATALTNVSQERVEVISVYAFQQNRFGNLVGESAPDGFYIYVLYEDQVVRLHADGDSRYTLESISEGDEADILVYKGALGMQWGSLIFTENSI